MAWDRMSWWFLLSVVCRFLAWVLRTPYRLELAAASPGPGVVYEERNVTVVTSAMSLSGITVAQARVIEPAVLSGVAVATGVSDDRPRNQDPREGRVGLLMSCTRFVLRSSEQSQRPKAP